MKEPPELPEHIRKILERHERNLEKCDEVLDDVKEVKKKYEDFKSGTSLKETKLVGWKGVAACVAGIGVLGAAIWADRILKQNKEAEHTPRQR